MKGLESVVWPHIVLAPWLQVERVDDEPQDLTTGWSCSFEAEDQDSKVAIKVRFELDWAHLPWRQDAVEFGVYASCRVTEFRELWRATETNDASVRLVEESFDEGETRDSVELLPVVWAKEVNPFQPGRLPEWLKDVDHACAVGAILGVSSVRHLKLGEPLGSEPQKIFDLVGEQDVPEGHFSLDWSSDKIQVKASVNTAKQIGLADKSSPLLAFSTIYVPATAAAIQILIDEDSEGSDPGDTLWRRALTAAIAPWGGTNCEDEPLDLAQRVWNAKLHVTLEQARP